MVGLAKRWQDLQYLIAALGGVPMFVPCAKILHIIECAERSCYMAALADLRKRAKEIAVIVLLEYTYHEI